MKTKLKKKIEEGKMGQKLKSIETADKMTANQIVAKTKEYYNQKSCSVNL